MSGVIRRLRAPCGTESPGGSQCGFGKRRRRFRCLKTNMAGMVLPIPLRVNHRLGRKKTRSRFSWSLAYPKSSTWWNGSRNRPSETSFPRGKMNLLPRKSTPRTLGIIRNIFPSYQDPARCMKLRPAVFRSPLATEPARFFAPTDLCSGVDPEKSIAVSRRRRCGPLRRTTGAPSSRVWAGGSVSWWAFPGSCWSTPFPISA